MKTLVCSLFVCIALLTFDDVVEAGSYQRTIDGHALVWNNYPKTDDQVAWSGQTDSAGYAMGSGTLSWYKGRVLVSRYSGAMARGKWNGTVINEDSDGKKFRGTYVNGTKSGDWVQIGGGAITANSTSQAGQYQKTYDGRAYVWNNYPKADDQAAWAGDIDTEGYATGQGKLTWYKNQTPVTTYVGEMVQGKWNGVVINQDEDGKRYQGTFVDGVKTGDWTQVAEFRRVVSPSQRELNNHWAAYLKEIQDDSDYANWSERPYDLYAKRK
jgi:hypothetical protein